MNRISLLFLVFFATFATACGGCGEENNTTAGTAEVVIEEVDPSAGYPGVEMRVTFAIEPGEGTDEDGMQWEVNFGDGSTASGEGIEGAAAHSYGLAGQYDIEVSAIFDSEVVGTAVEPVRVFSPVDIEIFETRGSPAVRRVGDELQVSFSVRNNTAAEVLTPYEVAAYLSEDDAVTSEDVDDLVPLGTHEIVSDGEDAPVIRSGEQRDSAFGTTIPSDLRGGDYYVVTVLDPRERVADTDRSNNFDVSSGIVRIDNPEEALPDPCARDLFVSPDRAFPQLNSITLGFVACNNGGEDAFDLVAKTYLSVGDDELDPGSDLLLHTSEPFDVFANDAIDIGPDQLVLPVGQEIIPSDGPLEVWVIVVVESLDAAAPDADPDNNSLVSAEPIIVTDEPVMGPDIVVRDFTVAPHSTFLNGSLNVTADIGNEGTVDVGSFFCGIYLGQGPRVNTTNDPRLTNVNIPSLDAGASTDVDMPITVPGLFDPGVYHFYIVCDPLNALQEPFRSNNAFIYPEPITITDEADVDLFVETLTVPGTVAEGELFDVVARICVQGSNPSGLTKAELFRNAGTQVDFDADPLIEFDVPNILPGAENCLEMSLEVEASCEEFQDLYAFGVEVDVDNRLPEFNETNNRKSGSQPLTVTGEFCQCVEDGFEPNDRPIDAVPLMEGTTSAAICTAGNVDYWGVDLSAGDSLIVTTTFDSTKGSLTTTLFDESGLQQLASDSSADEQEVATFLVPAAGRYVIRVAGTTADDRNLYDLDVNVLPQVTGVDVVPRDVTIPFGDSFSIGASIDVGFRIYNLGQTAASAFDAEIYISPDPSVADDGNNTLVASRQISSVSASGILDVTVPVTLPTTLTDGDYWIFVVLDPQGVLGEDDVTNNRELSRQFSIATACFDPLEPNDSFGEATPISSGSFSNLQACASADDYYELCLPTGKRFDVTVNFNDANGDIDLQLFDSQATLLDSSANTGVDVEQVSWDFVNGDQCFFIRAYVVTLDPDLETTYSMTVNVDDVDPSLLCDSVFEPNDNFENASSLVAAIDQSFTIDRCPASDTDYYFVNLSANQTVSFTATKNPESQPGTLRIQLYKPNQTPGPNQETGPGVPSATISDFTAATSGIHYVQITVGGSTRNVTYDLSEEGLGGIDLEPSNLVIGPGDYRADDEIRFAFDLTNQRSDTATAPEYEISFSTSATPDASDTSLGTFTAPDVSGNETVSLNEIVFVPSDAPDGQAYLHVVVDPAGTTGDLDPSNNRVTTTIDIVP